MSKRHTHPSNVVEHQTDGGRTLEIYLAHEDFADLLAGGTVLLDDERASFDHRAILTGDERSERAVVQITIVARDL